MVYEKPKKHEMGLERTVELFKQTQFNMQSQAGHAVNTALVVRNWLFGWYIVEYEKSGANRKDLYGQELMVKLSERLSGLLGKGFSRRSLDQFRQFYETYKKIGQTLSAQSIDSETDDRNSILSDKLIKPQMLSRELQVSQPTPEYSLKIWQTLSAEFSLSWSHYVFLMAIRDTDERDFYQIEAAKENWSLRELKRQFDASMYERLALSRDKDEVKKLSQKGLILSKPKDIIKNPYVLEFLGLDEKRGEKKQDQT